MPDDYVDPSGNTEQFRAFAQAPPDQPTRSRTPLLIGVAVAAAVLAAVLVYLLVS